MQCYNLFSKWNPKAVTEWNLTKCKKQFFSESYTWCVKWFEIGWQLTFRKNVHSIITKCNSKRCNCNQQDLDLKINYRWYKVWGKRVRRYPLWRRRQFPFHKYSYSWFVTATLNTKCALFFRKYLKLFVITYILNC